MDNAYQMCMEWPTIGDNFARQKYAVQGGGAVQRAGGLGNRHGGVMNVRRAIIIPAILALGVAGSVLPGLAMSATAGPAASVHVHVVAAAANPSVVYHA